MDYPDFLLKLRVGIFLKKALVPTKNKVLGLKILMNPAYLQTFIALLHINFLFIISHKYNEAYVL